MPSTSRPQHRRVYARPSAITSPSGIQHILQPYRHHPGELATFAIATLSTDGSEWSKQQRRAMFAFDAHAFSAMNLPQINAAPVSDRDGSMLPRSRVMQRILAHFSDVFFLGSLGNVKFEWSVRECSDPTLYGVSYFDRIAKCHSIALHPGLCLPLSIKHASYGPGPHVLGTLLHECCHAFLSSYCCIFHSESCPTDCERNEQKFLGNTGHGTAWVQLATHVQAVARRYLDESIDLDIDMGMSCKFASSGRVPVVDDAETASCHIESHSMLAQFRMLVGVPTDNLSRHLLLRRTAERDAQRY